MARTKGISYFLQEHNGEWVDDYDFRTHDYTTTQKLANARPFSPGEFAVIREHVQQFTTLTPQTVGFSYIKERHTPRVRMPRM